MVDSDIKADILNYNMDVLNIYKRDAFHDTVAIRLPKGTLIDSTANSASNTVYLADTMTSASGEKITDAGQKTLGKVDTGANAYFTWNYKTKSTADAPAVTVTDADRAAKLQAFLDDDENVNASIEAAKLKSDLELTIKKEMTVDFNNGTIKTLKIDTQSTGRIIVKNLNVTTVTINAPNADVYFEGVQVTGTNAKVELQNVLTKLDLDGTSRAVVIDKLDVKESVTHNINIKVSNRSNVTLTDVNLEVKTPVTVTIDPLTIGTLNVKGNATTVLDNVAVTTANVKAAASLSLEGGDNTITNLNLSKGVKLTEVKLDMAHGALVSDLGTITKDVTEYNNDGTNENGTTTTAETDYIAGENGITKKVADLPVTLTTMNFTDKSSKCTINEVTSGAALVVSGYNMNTQLQIDLPANTSIKDYKGISFLEFPQIYPHSPDFISILINNF